jgi:sortase A
VPLALWSLVLLIAMVVSTVGVYRWSRWRTYLLMAPIVLALIWCVYENLACLLPNMY